MADAVREPDEHETDYAAEARALASLYELLRAIAREHREASATREHQACV